MYYMGNQPTFSVNYGSSNVVLQLDHELDTDEDGLADFWEAEHFGFANAGSPIGDGDLDQFQNRSEMIAGTNPNDPWDFLRIDCVTLADGGITLEWANVIGKHYALWISNTLAPNAFTPSIIDMTSADDRIYLHVPSGTEKLEYYRLEVSDPGLE
ncbi:MAG: hypothetical protein ACI97B_004278 [Verrucomicrobiales bacterium]|jgi:hypothetical protein